MKKNILTIVSLNIAVVFGNNELDSTLNVLDSEIKQAAVYFDAKERRIETRRVQRNELSRIPEHTYLLNAELYNEYKDYISDSAVHYLNLNLDIARILNDSEKMYETRMALAYLFVRLGMYKEASDLLERVDRSSLDKRQLPNYYIAYRELYLGLGQYSQNTMGRSQYWAQAKMFNDSVRNTVSETSEEYLQILEKSLRLDSAYQEALLVNDQRLKLVTSDMPGYALVTFHRSLLYRKMGDIENEKKYLTLSAISDVRLAIRDNASIPILANLLMEGGDINRAYLYIRSSLDNIQKYNTRIRSSEILNIQMIIDREYKRRNEEKSLQLKSLLIVACLLSILLIMSIIFLYKYLKRYRHSAQQLKETNGELASFNQKLREMNRALKGSNLEVAEANHIKEEYIAYFLNVCSKYIIKLDDYRKMVRKKLLGRNYEELYKITQDNTLVEDEMRDLFANFDTMFINLFPDFLKEFNALLMEDEQISVKKGEVLNTELRIYALIRLGITDSSKIADFLGYSVNTIYNYRTKMKNKSKVSREEFELFVKKIGAFN
ncbi:DUF6377 domain-containing protein [Sphingobacterium corticibacterium]|uniref:Transcriptional regulator n=1 Tax=Sphingobacterium corticibacterium TaxID=2484746 RepID=A0A4Q6XPY0_9SPHI|nr:DUF6377 domain-containing protein [Sphingobacterium corticibacterium]RZF58679.1 transcriptional regulator [Sphingobacterium corticibacterium]